jgi:signal transduction histidine kinase
MRRAYTRTYIMFSRHSLAIIQLALHGARSGPRPFNDEELAAMETCIEYATVTAESALELGAERDAMRVERERTAQFQQEMLRIVGHDLRSPVAAILMSTEILATSGNEDAAATQAIARIESFAHRMSRMVDQLADLTRARLGGQLALSCSRMCLLPVVDTVIGSLRSTHPESTFELVGDDVRGNWDPDRIAQMLSTVLGNAVKFGRAGGTIRVGVTHSDATARIAIHNEIRDQPMSVETLATLFEPYRNGSAHERVGIGLGLDLYLAYEIVRAHRGTITAESSVAEGTTFLVVLPDALVR